MLNQKKGLRYDFKLEAFFMCVTIVSFSFEREDVHKHELTAD